MPVVAAILVIIIATVPGKPDMRFHRNEPSLEKCQADAKEFLSQGVPHIEGAIGSVAGCVIPPSHEGEEKF